MEQRFQGQLRFQRRKLGMCPSLAELDAIGFPKKNLLFGKTVFRIRQRGSTPAFAYQRAAIAPLPCSNLQS